MFNRRDFSGFMSSYHSIDKSRNSYFFTIRYHQNRQYLLYYFLNREHIYQTSVFDVCLLFALLKNIDIHKRQSTIVLRICR